VTPEFLQGISMVVIRLARGGSHKRPFYHVGATDSRNRRDGRFIERVGFFNPIARGNDTKLNLSVERIEHWRSNGAQLSPRVEQLLKDFSKAAA
jgi:small subunit ribosomal protein S16